MKFIIKTNRLNAYTEGQIVEINEETEKIELKKMLNIVANGEAEIYSEKVEKPVVEKPVKKAVSKVKKLLKKK